MSGEEVPSEKPRIWQRSSAEGIYLHVPSGVYYARYKANGKRTFKSLETDRISKARLARSSLMVEVDSQRLHGQSGSPTPDLNTLGDLAKLLVDQLETSTQRTETKANYRQQLETLRRCWPGGNFDSVRPATISHDTLVSLRASLQQIRWKGHLHRRSGKGYSNAYTNQILSRLNNVLALARAHHLCGHDPFKQKLGLRGQVYLPLNHKAPRLPSTAEMERVFAELTQVSPKEREHPALFEWRRRRAIGASEHARFLAFSGASRGGQRSPV